MIINSTLIFCLIPELKEKLPGARITKICISSDRRELLFHLRDKKRELALFFSAHPENYRIEIWEKDEVDKRGEEFQKTNLLWFATGGYVREVEQVDFDRIIKVCCEKRNQFGGDEGFALLFELTGRNSNVVLTKPDGMVVDCLKKVDASKSRFRQILPGQKYLPPPPSQKRNPFLIQKGEFTSLVASTDSTLSEWLMSNFSGMDEFLTRKILLDGGLKGEAKLSGLDRKMIEHLWRTFSQTFKRIANGELSFQMVTDKDGVPFAISCVDLPFLPEERKIGCESLNSAIKSFFSRKFEIEERTKRIHRLSSTLRKALKKLERREEKIGEDLKQAEKSELYRRFGELLMMNKAIVKKGQTSIKLKDIFDPQHPEVEIPLNPRLSAVSNAQRYFKKHRKAKEALSILQKRRTETQKQIARLTEILKQLEEDEGLVDLDEIERSLSQMGWLQKPQPEGKNRGKKEFSPRRFLTRDGWEILVGRNNQENDYLSFKFARPNDLWFHAQDVPGSHVLLRRKEKKTEPSDVDIKEAAKVAAYFSKARGEKKAKVIYTQVKYVRKPKGGKPGLALVEKEKTILVEPGLPEQN